MTITLLGQAGLYFKLENGVSFMLDPYLSDSLRQKEGECFARRVPLDGKWLEKSVDMLLFTHDHADHFDMESISPILDKEDEVSVFAPYPVFLHVKERWNRKHPVTVMRPGVECTSHTVRIRTVHAYHETPDAVGYLIQTEGKNIYCSGDTLYNRLILQDVEDVPVDVAFVCINGKGNNMNAEDSARLMRLMHPTLVVPVHWDMFDSFGTDPLPFSQSLENICIVKAYQSIRL